MKHLVFTVWMLGLGAVVMAQTPAAMPAMTSVPMLSCQGYPCVDANIGRFGTTSGFRLTRG